MKIVVAIDGSANALRAVKHAIYLAKYLPEAWLEAIHVVDYGRTRDEYLLVQNQEELVLKREQKIQPVRDLAKEHEIELPIIVLKGEPSKEIIDYVRDESVDQLVIGSRGLNVLQELVLGSVSYKVVKHANCPVTVVK